MTRKKSILYNQPRIGIDSKKNWENAKIFYANKEIQDCIKRDAIRWNCSQSWIIHTALAAFYDVDIITPFQNKRKNIALRK